MSGGRKDWSEAFPSVGSWFVLLLVAAIVVGVFYGPIYWLDLWDTREWARENPGANVVMWVIFAVFWGVVLWLLLRPAPLPPDRERQVLAAGHPPCPESGRPQRPPQGNAYKCPTCWRVFFDEAQAFREFVMPAHLTPNDVTSLRHADKRADKRDKAAGTPPGRVRCDACGYDRNSPQEDQCLRCSRTLPARGKAA